MKAKLEFDLPEDQDEFNHAIRGIDYSIAIEEYSQIMRSHLKYEVNPEWDTKTVEALWEKYWEIMRQFEQ